MERTIVVGSVANAYMGLVHRITRTDGSRLTLACGISQERAILEESAGYVRKTRECQNCYRRDRAALYPDSYRKGE